MQGKLKQELIEIQELLLKMSDNVLEMVSNVVHSLLLNEKKALKSIEKFEDLINDFQVKIDERSLKALALYQPTASDLRLLLGIIKLNTELERIGDHALNISESVGKMSEHPAIKPLSKLQKMADLTSKMLYDSISSFKNYDLDQAKTIILLEDKVDRLSMKLLTELKKIMVKDKSTIEPAMDLIVSTNNLQKIADHAANIAEIVIFVKQGKDVRHHSLFKLFQS
jgi:phosphate transport system protein